MPCVLPILDTLNLTEVLLLIICVTWQSRIVLTAATFYKCLLNGHKKILPPPQGTHTVLQVELSDFPWINHFISLPGALEYEEFDPISTRRQGSLSPNTLGTFVK